ncbi:ABC transporter permease [Alicyclobacillus fastidiosus]|uniref:ABC transporter permease n=1 Tax=Alicyclobacillus fastidiosus TaxID=392011 RepID=A0ABY6ZE49_9BACL|nr:ABC transporter permease [Alicyclobacillus fastidiosus]WAH41083.1 ABC transporter permease [Alicyclobacillus fastidiosus]GMA62635.1 multidrug ABC transporter substrate-binding protein [Alicyclobacillus fastidiosus]
MKRAKALSTAFRSLWTHPLRTILTLLGMVIGVGSVVALMSIGTASTNSVASQIQGLGTNVLEISPGQSTQNGISQGLGSGQPLTLSDVTALQKDSALSAVAPVQTSSGQVVFGSTNYQTAIEGSTPDIFSIRNLTMSAGRPFNVVEENDAANVAVLGATAAQNIFGNTNPVGQTIWINGITFQVIGELNTQGSSGATNNDNEIIIPYSTLQDRFTGTADPSMIYASAVSSKSMSMAQAQIEMTMRQTNGLSFSSSDNFTITNQATLLSAMQGVNQTMQNLLGGIASISLLVGGIGIMNILLVSVTERTREIGLRKALGATKGAVLGQFLLESGFVGLIGGIAGIALGGMAAIVIGKFMDNAVQINMSSVWLSFIVSVAIGLVFGIYPAMRASRLSPINALRFE